MKCGELNHHASLPDLSGKLISVFFSVTKKQTTFFIFLINSCEFPPVEMFFYVKFSVKILLVMFNKATVKARLTLVRILKYFNKLKTRRVI